MVAIGCNNTDRSYIACIESFINLHCCRNFHQTKSELAINVLTDLMGGKLPVKHVKLSMRQNNATIILWNLTLRISKETEASKATALHYAKHILCTLIWPKYARQAHSISYDVSRGRELRHFWHRLPPWRHVWVGCPVNFRVENYSRRSTPAPHRTGSHAPAPRRRIGTSHSHSCWKTFTSSAGKNAHSLNGAFTGFWSN